MEEGYPASAATQHKLSTKWVLWFDYPVKAPQAKKRTVWENNLRKVATIETLEDFWGVMNKVAPAGKLPISCNYHLFREGIEPKWEDKANEGGGKWVHAQPKQQQQQQRKIDRSWIATCVAAISEQLELADDVNHVCGVVVSARKNQDRLCLWLSGSESAVMAIGARWKQLLDLRGQVKIGYQVHAEAISGGTTGGSSFSRSAKFVL